jgi:hypothetical protein
MGTLRDAAGATGNSTLIAGSASVLRTAALGGAAGMGSLMLGGGTNGGILVRSSASVVGRQRR